MSAKNAKQESSVVVKAYLLGYNAAQTLGWSFLLYQFISHQLTPTGKPLFETVKCTLVVCQIASVLEVVHAFLRLVASSPFVTIQQLSSRFVMIFGVMMATQASKLSIGLPLTLCAWSVTEVIRYGNYTLTLTGFVPYFIKWLRYTTFIVLYPLGLTGELLCLYAALREVQKTNMWSIEMPNCLNFSFSYQYCLLIIMIFYIPSFIQLYLHMFTQRKKALGDPLKKQA